MLSPLCAGWGKSVFRLFIGVSKSLGLPTIVSRQVWGPVYNIGRFCQLFTNLILDLFHGFAARFTPVIVLVLPSIHTTYYNELLYLFNSSNSRRIT
jgi:hypothetical protein